MLFLLLNNSTHCFYYGEKIHGHGEVEEALYKKPENPI